MKPEDEITKSLIREANRAQKLLKGLSVKSVKRFRPGELMIEFEDRTRLFVNAKDGVIDLSIT